MPTIDMENHGNHPIKKITVQTIIERLGWMPQLLDTPCGACFSLARRSRVRVPVFMGLAVDSRNDGT